LGFTRVLAFFKKLARVHTREDGGLGSEKNDPRKKFLKKLVIKNKIKSKTRPVCIYAIPRVMLFSYTPTTPFLQFSSNVRLLNCSIVGQIIIICRTYFEDCLARLTLGTEKKRKTRQEKKVFSCIFPEYVDIKNKTKKSYFCKCIYRKGVSRITCHRKSCFLLTDKTIVKSDYSSGRK
jgi:hypothetical protein